VGDAEDGIHGNHSLRVNARQAPRPALQCQPVAEPPKHYAFIDAQNLNLSVQGMGWKLDLKRFRIYLKDKYHVTKAFYFIGHLPGQEPLYQALRGYGYELVFKEIVKGGGGKVKGNVDAELVLQAMVEYPHYDKAVLVTSDGDFYCLVEYLLRQGKFERLLIPDRNRFSSLYRKRMQHIHFLNGLEEKLAYRGK